MRAPRRNLARPALLGVMLLPLPTAAAQNAAADEDAQGFEAVEIAPVTDADSGGAGAEPPPALTLAGALGTLTGIWTGAEHAQRASHLRTSLELDMGYQLQLGSSAVLQLRASGRGEYDFVYLLRPPAADAATREQYQWQLIGGETFAALRAGAFDLTVGRQIVNWSQGEVLSVLDVLNPRDLREPGLTDAKDLRLAVLMSRVGLSLGSQRLDLVAVHESYFGLRPPPLAAFSPLRTLLLENAGLASAFAGKELRFRDSPGHSLEQWRATSFMGRWSFSGSGVDLALQAGSVLDALGVPMLPAAEAFSQPAFELELFHGRYTLLGTSGSVALGPCLLRWELSAELDRPVTMRRLDTPIFETFAARHTQLNGMLGLTYFGAGRTGFGIELLDNYVIGNPAHDPALAVAPLWPLERLQLAVRADYEFWDERARASALLIVIDPLDPIGVAARVELSVTLTPALKLSAGMMIYGSRARFNFFYGLQDSNLAFARLRYDFSLL